MYFLIRTGMSDLRLIISRGRRLLSRHDAYGAMRLFELALENCPASNPEDLYWICFYLGIALKRLGHPETAIKSWVSCQKLKKRGYSKRMLLRMTNEYGMQKQCGEEQDDWKAFASIQISRYLLSKSKRIFSTPAEQDMILDLLYDHWKSILRSGILTDKTCSEKHEYFTRARIVFPTVLVRPLEGQPIISINFHTQKKMKLTDRCYCGSGLPFRLCCGRTSSSEEVLSGIF